MASSLSPVVQLCQSIFATNCCQIAAAVILSYDTLLGVDREIRIVWRSPKHGASLLYLFNRYLQLASIYLSLAVTVLQLDTINCTVLSWLSIVTEVLGLLGPSAFTTLRVYALTGKKKSITGAVLFLSLGPFVVNASTVFYQDHVVNSGPPLSCNTVAAVSTAGYTASVVASRGSLMFADLLAIIVTWCKTYKTSQLVAETGCGPSLSKVMLNSGIFYFCSLAALNILDVVLGVVGIQVQAAGNGTYVVIFVDPLSSLLICRFLLDLRSVSERLADGSSGSVSSLNFGGVEVGPQVPSNNPSFLDSFAGPVQFSPAPEEDEATPAPMAHLDVIPAAAPSQSPVA